MKTRNSIHVFSGSSRPIYYVLLGTAIGIATPFSAQAKKPNIVYILADDLGYGDVQCYNAQGKIPTPNIDRIATEGMKFTDAHTNSGICTPTRYGIMTGRYAWRTPLKKAVIKGMAKPLIKSDRATVAGYLKTQGYQTACIGKWHLGLDWNYKNKALKAGAAEDLFNPFKAGPVDRGFDYFFGMSASFNLAPHLYIENRMVLGDVEKVTKKEELRARNINGSGGWVAKGFQQDQVLSTFTHKTCEWIEQNADQPFFAYMPLNAPHYPLIPRPEFRGKSEIGLHGDFMMEIDWAVGEVLNTLDRLKLTENTIVIFTSDNGISEKVHVEDMQAKGHYPSGIYRGMKGNIWEGAHRVPFIVRWPETVRPGTSCDQAICSTDLMATCADLLGSPLVDDAGVDSVSFLSALRGQPISGNQTRMIVHHSGTGYFGARKGKWKLVLDESGKRPSRFNPKDQPVINHNPNRMLFDMEQDAIESTNVGAQHPEVVESMMVELGGMIYNGRSTPGPNQATDLPKPDWKQIESLRSYLK